VRTINFSDARSNLKQVLDDVISDHTITLIKRRDTEDAVVMSLGDYNSILETLYLFGSRANAERLGAAMAEADASLPAGARILGPEGAIVRSTGAPGAGAGVSKTSLKMRGTKTLARGRADDVTPTKGVRRAAKSVAAGKPPEAAAKKAARKRKA
jgi:antitoxin YefM